MKAETLEAQKTSITTEFIIRMLGLGICSDTMVLSCSWLVFQEAAFAT